MRALPHRMVHIATALVLALAWTAATAVQPSWACGCGAMISRSGVDVGQETSIVRYDDRTGAEQIVMRLSVRSKTPDAAWLFPTPAAAEVRLGDRQWFSQLDRLTDPEVVRKRTWWGPLFSGHAGDDAAPGGVRGLPPVTVLGEKRLGPFQVATLAGGDSKALAGWLSSNGYKLAPRLAQALQPYVAMRWTYVAVKLVPGAGRTLTGDLDPLHITFHSGELVYPMRLSHLARSPQSVHLYVLAAHRVEQTGPQGHPAVTFAGWVTSGQVASPGLKELVGRRLFLTERVDPYLTPSSINDDFHFRYRSDTPYRETIYREEVVRFLGVPAGWLLVLVLVLSVALVIGVIIVVTLRRRASLPR
jgi:hypothetical protein